MRTFWLFLFLGTLLASCENDPSDIQRFMPPATGVEVAKEVEMLYSDSAFVRVRITAPIVNTFSDPKNPRREFPEGIKMEFFDNNQQVTSYVVAKKATRFEKEGRLELRDSVVMSNTRKERMEAQELNWNEAKKLISTQRFVKIIKADETTWGYGLESNMEFTKCKIHRVTGIAKVKTILGE